MTEVIALALDALAQPGTGTPHPDASGVLDRVLAAGLRPVVVVPEGEAGRAEEVLAALGADPARVDRVVPEDLASLGAVLVTDRPGEASRVAEAGRRAAWVNRRDRRALEDVTTLPGLEGVPEALLG